MNVLMVPWNKMPRDSNHGFVVGGDDEDVYIPVRLRPPRSWGVMFDRSIPFNSVSSRKRVVPLTFVERAWSLVRRAFFWPSDRR